METHFSAIEQAAGEITRERVMQDLQALVRDAEELLKATADDMGGKADELRKRLTVALENAKVTYMALQNKAVEGSKAADKVIREYPYQSIGVAFGVGLLIGVLVNRR